MMLKNTWYVAAIAEEVGRRPLARTLLDHPVVLYRTEAGQPVALQDRCPHRAVPLSLGRVIGDELRCAYHGLRFDPEGRCRHIPCQPSIPAQARVVRYPVADRHGFTWWWPGDAALADEAAIPALPWMDSPAWAACTGYTHVEAHYQLLCDNLLDLSHESFLHEASIGNEAVAQAPVKTEVRDNQVRVHRDILDCEPPPFYVRATGFTTRIHRWHTTIYEPPATLVIENGSYPAAGRREDALERRVLHLLTPQTAGSTHYFWAVARAHHVDDDALTSYIREATARTFDEDKAMLEAQQRLLSREGSPFPMALVTDAGPIQARRLLQSRLEQEARATAGATPCD